MWFGKHRGVLHQERERFVDFAATNNFGHVLGFHRAADGALWILGDALWRYDGGAVSKFTETNGLPKSRLRAVTSAPNGDLWIRADNGLTRYDGKQFTTFTSTNGLPGKRVTCLLSEPNGLAWVGTDNGVARYDGKEFVHRTAGSSGLAGNIVSVIFRDSAGRLWFGTDGGVASFDGVTWSSLDERDGLAGDKVNSIFEDDKGYLWFATDKGLCRYHKRKVPARAPNLLVQTDHTYADLKSVPTLTSGHRITIKASATDFKTRLDSRQYRYQVSSGVRSARECAASSEWLAPKKEAQMEWSTNQPGVYTVAVQFIDRDLNYSPPAVAVL